MLILSRKEGESLILTDSATGETIKLMVCKTTPKRTQVGIECTDRWIISRSEHFDDSPLSIVPETKSA